GGVVAQHPADMRKPQAAIRRVGVVGIVVDMAMVAAMARAPDEDAVLRGGGAEQGEKPLQQRVRLVSVVREQAMIASGDRQSIGCQQQCECQPVTPAVAMREAVPGHYADGDEKGAEQNAGRQPENFWSMGFFGHRFTHATVY